MKCRSRYCSFQTPSASLCYHSRLLLKQNGEVTRVVSYFLLRNTSTALLNSVQAVSLPPSRMKLGLSLVPEVIPPRAQVNNRFGTSVDDLIIEKPHVVGVNISDISGSSQFNSGMLGFDAVVLAVGHFAHDVYQMLLSHSVELVPKVFVQYKQEKKGETSLLGPLRNGNNPRNIVTNVVFFK